MRRSVTDERVDLVPTSKWRGTLPFGFHFNELFLKINWTARCEEIDYENEKKTLIDSDELRKNYEKSIFLATTEKGGGWKTVNFFLKTLFALRITLKWLQNFMKRLDRAGI